MVIWLHNVKYPVESSICLDREIHRDQPTIPLNIKEKRLDHSSLGFFQRLKIILCGHITYLERNVNSQGLSCSVVHDYYTQSVLRFYLPK